MTEIDKRSTRESRAGHGNWIGGSWCEARSGFSFTVESPLLETDAEYLEWPRSGAEDAEEALRQAGASRSEWTRTSPETRRAHLNRLCQSLTSELDLELAQLLDLEDEDLTEHALRLTGRFTSRSLDDLAREFSDSELLLARPDWRQLFMGFATTLTALQAGCPVILLSDATVPHLGRALARAAALADLPAGVLSVLHDDGWTVARAVLASGDVTDLFVSGDREHLAEHKRLVERCVPRSSSHALFGAGVSSHEDVYPRARLRFHEIRSRSTVVRSNEGLEIEAERILEYSLGRFGALDGVLDGRIGLALCAEREFSSFTAQLLAQLTDVELPLSGPLALDHGLARELARARERGLDEGATLLHGGGAGREGPGGSTGGTSSAILVPTIFTNVEEHMQLVRSSRPAPLLCLMRVPSEEAGDELVARLDALTRV